jgi:hypothetical protein
LALAHDALEVETQRSPQAHHRQDVTASEPSVSVSVGASWLLIGAATLIVAGLGYLLARWLRWIWQRYQIRCEIRDMRRVESLRKIFTRNS